MQVRRVIVGLLLMGLSWDHIPCVQAQAPAVPPIAENSERISLDLKGVDILDVLKLLSQKSKLNFIAGRNVSGKVTIFASDVDVWEAFELIIAANDLAFERRGAMVNVMTSRDYELLYGEKFEERQQNAVIPLRYAKGTQLATVLNQLKSNLGRVVVDESSNTLILSDVPTRLEELRSMIARLDRPTKTFVWELRYAKVKDLQDKVQETLSPEIGSLKIDERTNKLIVTDLPTVIDKINGMVKAFDAKTRQVMVESKIVQVNLSDSKTLGIDWKSIMGGLDSETRSNFDAISGDIMTGSITGWTLKFTGGTEPVSAVVKALQTIGKTDLISTPSITVTDNQEAKIHIGTREAYVTTTVVTPGGGSPATTSEQVTFIDVGVNLAVTPIIKSDGFVNMKIRPEVSSVSGTLETSQKNKIPIVKTSEVETNILLKSGSTLMIGGLIEDRVEKTTNQVPVVGDIPLLKYIFRNNTDTVKKVETIIFLTPYIVSGEESLLQAADFREKNHAALQEFSNEPTAFEMTSSHQLPPAYREALRRHLVPRLQNLSQGIMTSPASAVLTFRLRADGTLIGEPSVLDTKDPRIRQRLVEAVKGAVPFPAFPEEARANELQFRLAVEYGTSNPQR